MKLAGKTPTSTIKSFHTLAFASVLILVTSVSGPAVATTLPGITASLSSPSCPGSAHWHMAMLEYFVGESGATLPRDEGLARLQTLEIQPFLDGIASASDCGVTADIDIWDMGDDVYPITGDPPQLIQKEFLAKGYDVVMYRFPDQGGLGTIFLGFARGDRAIQFPITPHLLTFTDIGVPHESVIWHEWLHEAVFNIKGQKLDEGLPPDDVHYDHSKDPKYNDPQNNISTNYSQFYWDFTGGKIQIDGKFFGFTKADWIRIGTPTHPQNLTGAIGIYSGQWNAGKAILNLHVENPYFSIALQRSGKGARTITPSYTYDATRTSIRFSLPKDSNWKVCVTTKSTSDGAWIGRKVCQNVLFRNVTPRVSAKISSSVKRAISK